MQNKKLSKKLISLLDFSLLLLPLIILIGYIIVNQHLSLEISFSDIINGFNDLFSWLNETNIFILLNNLGKHILGVSNNLYTNPILTAIMLYTTYIIIVVLFNMVRNLLLLIPMWFNDMLKK